MIKGFFWLVLAYSLSQFYRACLSVFAPVLNADIGLGPDQVSTALGLWFLVFAAMQIPVGWLLDHRSPRKTAATLLALGGGGGALVFSLAQGPFGIYAAMILIGIGCSPVLMTSFYIFARCAPSNRFGTLAGLVLGFGSLGNLAASVPLSVSLDLIGWRATAVVLAGATVIVAGTIYKLVQDPPRLAPVEPGKSSGLGEVLRIWPLYPILAIAVVSYAPPAGLRGSWAGGYLADVYAMDASGIGRVTFFMALAMIAGSLAFGPLDRVIPNRKWIVIGGNLLTLALLVWLWHGTGQQSVVFITVLFVGIGFFGSAYIQIMNHGRTLLPTHLIGRGVTLINLFSIGGVGVFQIVTARVFGTSPQNLVSAYASVFAVFFVCLGVGIILYLFSTEEALEP